MQAVLTFDKTPEQIANELRNKQVFAKIMATKGKIFSVTFIKKDGTVRKMVCRIDKRLGHELVNPQTHQLTTETLNRRMMIRVWDMQKCDYRIVNCKTVIAFKCGE